MNIIVACSRPGMIRGGQRNPAVAAYALDHFSAAQLQDLYGDPHISVAVGELVSAASDGTDIAMRHALVAEKEARFAHLVALAGPRTMDQTADTVVTDPAIVVADAATGRTVQHAIAADTAIGAVIDPAAAAEAAVVKEVVAGELPMGTQVDAPPAHHDPAHETARAVRARGGRT